MTALMAAVRLPHVLSAVLVESPSLWTGEGRFLQVRYCCGRFLEFDDVLALC
jgi:hypothetical protein